MTNHEDGRLYYEDSDNESFVLQELDCRGDGAGFFWDTEESTTPMTTRPRFHRPPSPRSNSPRRPQQPPESSSSAAAATTTDSKQQFSEWTSLLQLPALHYHLDEEKGCRTESTCSCDGERSPLLLNNNTVKQQHSNNEKSGNSIGVSVVYGTINAIIVLPILMSFGSIIYRDDAFAPYMPVLIKLTLVSGVVHQLCFSTFSSLPFAVGQVQDAGLIFLSSMASDMVQYCRTQGHDDETMLATVTVGLSIATALLGMGLVLVGYLRLAQYVKHLPTRYVYLNLYTCGQYLYRTAGSSLTHAVVSAVLLGDT
jgi:hypothetical protein